MHFILYKIFLKFSDSSYSPSNACFSGSPLNFSPQTNTAPEEKPPTQFLFLSLFVRSIPAHSSYSRVLKIILKSPTKHLHEAVSADILSYKAGFIQDPGVIVHSL